jgi:hypothetical protein
MRIFIGLIEVAGRNVALKRGLEALGHSVIFATLSVHPAEYEAGEEPAWARFLRRVAEFRRRRRRLSPPLRYALLSLELALRWPIFLYLLATHDLFIYSSGTTFFRHWDYTLIRFVGKKLICQFHGSDSRPPYLNGAYATSPGFSIESCIEATRETKALVRKVDRLAHEVIDLPSKAYFHERTCVVRLQVGVPSGPYGEEGPGGEGVPSALGEIGILHAPSNIAYKGTSRIRETIERLLAKGYRIRYVEVTGRPHSQVIHEIRCSDLVVDELYSDYAMSAFTSEAAWFAKPVITCGYAVNFWKQLLTDDELPPTLYCEPEEFEEQLERLVADADLRQELGRRMSEYVRRVHHPAVVARRYLVLARGDVPESWRFDPRRMKTVAGGFFMPRERAKEIVRAMVAVGGPDSLQLSDKPELERAMLEWAGAARPS